MENITINKKEEIQNFMKVKMPENSTPAYAVKAVEFNNLIRGTGVGFLIKARFGEKISFVPIRGNRIKADDAFRFLLSDRWVRHAAIMEFSTTAESSGLYRIQCLDLSDETVIRISYYTPLNNDYVIETSSHDVAIIDAHDDIVEVFPSAPIDVYRVAKYMNSPAHENITDEDISVMKKFIGTSVGNNRKLRKAAHAKYVGGRGLWHLIKKSEFSEALLVPEASSGTITDPICQNLLDRCMAEGHLGFNEALWAITGVANNYHIKKGKIQTLDELIKSMNDSSEKNE